MCVGHVSKTKKMALGKRLMQRSRVTSRLAFNRITICMALTAPAVSFAAEPQLSGAAIEVEAWGVDDARQGIGFQVFDLLAKSTQVKIEARALPMERLTRSLKSGELDLALLPQSAGFDKLADRLCKIGTVRFSLAVPKARDITSIQQLRGTVFARLRGGQHLDTHPKLEGLTAFPVTSMKQGFQMLALGRVSAVTCTMPGCRRAIKSAGMELDQMAFLPLDTTEVHLYATRSPRVAEGFDIAKRQLKGYCSSPQAQRQLVELIEGFDEH